MHPEGSETSFRRELLPEHCRRIPEKTTPPPTFHSAGTAVQQRCDARTSFHRVRRRSAASSFLLLLSFVVTVVPSPALPTPSTPPYPPGQLNHHSKGTVNLISYQDAAFAVVAALNAGIAQSKGEEGAPEVKGKIFLAADHHPMTRRRICELALGHPRFARRSMPRFSGDATPPHFIETLTKKVYDSSWTRKTLGWEPQCPSMEEYFKMERELALEDEGRELQGGDVSRPL